MSNLDTCRYLPSGLIQTRTGIIIGGAAKPRPAEMSGDAVRIQAALLEKRTQYAPTNIVNVASYIASYIWRWL